MARFYGEIGFGESVETVPGVYEDVVTERKYFGDVLNNIRRMENGESVNDNFVLNNSISILSDTYASEHIFAIRYVRWSGSLWTVSTVQVQRPRLILQIGGVYNGPKAPVTGTP